MPGAVHPIFVLAHKLREAMAASSKAVRIGGDGRVVEIDGAYFGGHVRPENLAADRVDRRLAEHRSGKRQVVVVMRERGGPTLVQVVPSEEAALPIIPQRVAKATVLHADESPAWNRLHASFPMRRINHQQVGAQRQLVVGEQRARGDREVATTRLAAPARPVRRSRAGIAGHAAAAGADRLAVGFRPA